MKKLMMFGDLDNFQDLDISNDYLGIDVTDLFSIKRSTEIFYDNSPECVNPSIVINNINFKINVNELSDERTLNIKASSTVLIEKSDSNKVHFLSLQKGGKTTCIVAKLESKLGIIPRYSYELLICWDTDKIYECSLSMQLGGVGSKVHSNYYFDLEKKNVINRSDLNESKFKVIDSYIKAIVLDSILKDCGGFSKLTCNKEFTELPCYEKRFKPENVRKVFLDLGLEFYNGIEDDVFEFFGDIIQINPRVKEDLSVRLSLLSNVPSGYKEIKNPNLSYLLDCGKTICLLFPFRKIFDATTYINATHCVLMYKRHVGLVTIFPDNDENDCSKFHIMYNIRTGEKADTEMITALEKAFISDYPKLIKLSNKL